MNDFLGWTLLALGVVGVAGGLILAGLLVGGGVRSGLRSWRGWGDGVWFRWGTVGDERAGVARVGELRREPLLHRPHVAADAAGVGGEIQARQQEPGGREIRRQLGGRHARMLLRRREAALRIALASRAMPNASLPALIELLQRRLGEDIDEEKLRQTTVTMLKTGFASADGEEDGELDAVGGGGDDASSLPDADILAHPAMDTLSHLHAGPWWRPGVVVGGDAFGEVPFGARRVACASARDLARIVDDVCTACATTTAVASRPSQPRSSVLCGSTGMTPAASPSTAACRRTASC